jgi:hypothetical protein
MKANDAASIGGASQTGYNQCRYGYNPPSPILGPGLKIHRTVCNAIMSIDMSDISMAMSSRNPCAWQKLDDERTGPPEIATTPKTKYQTALQASLSTSKSIR